MTKFQFFLVSTLITSVVFLFIGSREGNSLIPISMIVALSYLGHRFIPESIWDTFTVWANSVTNRRIFRTKLKRLPASKSRRLR